MSNPLKEFLKSCVLSRRRGQTPRKSLPLDSVKFATVLIDSEKEDAGQTAAAVKAFFGAKGIELRLFQPGPKDLNIFGILKKKVRGGQETDGENSIFISLVEDPDSWLSEYESNHSLAAFKVGRSQIKGEVFDLVVLSAGHSQSETFEEIKKLLNKIVR